MAVGTIIAVHSTRLECVSASTTAPRTRATRPQAYPGIVLEGLKGTPET